MNEHETEERSHWEKRSGRFVIVCDQPECDWWGTAYASQFAIHHERAHRAAQEKR